MAKRISNIILFGETGNGVSTLGNELLGFNAFKISNWGCPATKLTYGMQGKEEKSSLFVIDTPGLQDSYGSDKKYTIQLLEYVKDHKILNAVIVVFNYQQVRFPYNIQTLLKLLFKTFQMIDIGKHLALVFTNCFAKVGKVTQEQKLSKIEKVLPEFKKVIKEASGSEVPDNIPIGFIDIDPEEGIDDDGKMDLDRIIKWVSYQENLNVDKMQMIEPDENKETQKFNEIRIEGEYIIITLIIKERDVYCQLDGSISYGEWKEKERKEEKILNPVEKENEKIMKELKKENEKNQEKAHKQFLEMIASKRNCASEIIRFREIMQEEEKRIREEDEKRIKQEKDDEKRKTMEKELQEKNEKQQEKIKKRKYLEKLLTEIKNSSKYSKEEKSGECKMNKNEFSAGIIEENELIKEVLIPDKDSVFKTECKFEGIQSKTLERIFNRKFIVGWKLESTYDNDLGGYWERKSEVLGTSSYSFVVNSYPGKGCNWKLRIWVADNILPIDID